MVCVMSIYLTTVYSSGVYMGCESDLRICVVFPRFREYFSLCCKCRAISSITIKETFDKRSNPVCAHVLYLTYIVFLHICMIPFI